MTPYDNPPTWCAYSILTAAQMQQLADEIGRTAKACDEAARSFIGLGEALRVCAYCGGTKHHKGFREWEECDNCSAPWG